MMPDQHTVLLLIAGGAVILALLCAVVWAMAVLSRAVARFGCVVDESERKLEEIRARMDALSGKDDD
jgi:Na+-transporting methylmalonyl-CoA/oxaloacetate decarboxylase gamma subunit